MIIRRLATIAALLGLLGAGVALAVAPANASIALVGATLIDVSHGGRGSADIPDSIVLIDGGRIVAIGDRAHVTLPRNVHIVRLNGRYIIPGLIDGFGAMRTQGFADAYLYEGVTSVYVPLAAPDGSIDGETRRLESARGPSVLTGAPIGGYAASGASAPAHHWIEHRLNDRRLDRKALIAAVDAAAAAGHSGITVGRDVWPDQLDTIVTEAHRKGLFVTAELAFTNYSYAVRAGVDAFIRNDNYQLSLASAQSWLAYVDDPTGGGGRTAMRAICGAEDVGAATAHFGEQLAKARTTLMPVLTMEATADDVGGPNPWTLPGAAFVTSADLDDPVEPLTGARPFLTSHPDRKEAIRACARRKQANDSELHRHGATYLVGTATPSFGVMPGSGVHVELKLLRQIGLTPREALAAATGNYAELPGWSDRGILAPGRRADLVVLKTDPRVTIEAVDQIDAVMISGAFVDRDGLMKARKRY